jgi:hypothetical protein
LVILTADGTHVTVDGLKVQNRGWELVANDPNKEYEETVASLGYTMTKHEAKECLIYEPGNFVIGEYGEVKRVD